MGFRITTSLIRVEYAQALRLIKRKNIKQLSYLPAEGGWWLPGEDWYIDEKTATRLVNNNQGEFAAYTEFSDGSHHPTRLDMSVTE